MVTWVFKMKKKIKTMIITIEIQRKICFAFISILTKWLQPNFAQDMTAVLS